MKYVMSRIKLNNRDVTYFSYMSEMLKIIANNIVGIVTGEGALNVEKSILDILNVHEHNDIPQESADDIIDRIKNGLNSIK